MSRSHNPGLLKAYPRKFARPCRHTIAWKCTIDVIPETGLNYNTGRQRHQSKPQTCHGVCPCPLATDVQIFFPDDKNSVGYYNFTVGENRNPAEPLNAIPSMRTTGTEADVFVNTGVHFLKDFEVMFDAVDGYYGIRYVGAKNSGYAATL